jgi:CheY-like chemotaxis protein
MLRWRRRCSWQSGRLSLRNSPSNQNPFQAGLLFVSACFLLTLFVYIRNSILSFLTRVIFLRSNIAEALSELQQAARASQSESEYLRHTAEVISRFLRASRFDMTAVHPLIDGTLKTLIVDDEPIARRVLREERESIAGVEIVGEADNGALALDKIEEYRPDLVLLDLQMPAMSGLEVVRNIRRGTHIPVIVIGTAYDKYALQAFEAGAVDYLLKAVGRECLVAAH